VSAAGRQPFFELDLAALETWCGARGMPRFAAKQLAEWVYAKGVVDVDRMTNLSKAHRDMLAHEMEFLQGNELRSLEATDGTRKLLLGWPAPGVTLPVLNVATGRETECVMIPSEDRRTACVSSQMGCPVGCRFCASGLEGVEGNLTAGRIVEQVWRLGRLPNVGRVSNVVFMGMGEPLANFANVTQAIRTIIDDLGFDISRRRVTLSTSGLVPQIYKLAEETNCALAVSLHAPDDALRDELVPINRKHPIAELLEACWHYIDEQNGRSITFEYVMLDGVNDQPSHARELARLMRGKSAKLNLIPFNPFPASGLTRSPQKQVLAFARILGDAGIVTTIRKTRGDDIDAACGQLRLREEKAGAAA